ncbi:LysR family transcriptional regulator [Breoghania corrubedonensis]|uniref:LysR family transcriptional regulator n=1 Tax=Breoghania corrubedonensis TaxID=665038 RepID=A0A2T5V9U9_9HYPH|nr:LysR family transcriptional regulator [Breoghania corrubedonensis]PTW60501.1 LysR family transcriptional regulator [Breoghania corrubedonensis]
MLDLAFDLCYLQYAKLVAEHRSFRRAADVLDLSQSTISRRVQSLKLRLGISLLERSRADARLTHSGAEVIRQATFGAEHLRHAVNDLRSVQRGYVGELRLGIVGSIAAGFLSTLFCSYRSRFPNIDVTVEETCSRSNAAAILNGRLDAAFIVGVPELPGCRTPGLWNERILLALPSQHAQAAQENVFLKDLRDETFIVRPSGPGPEIQDFLIRQMSDQAFRPRIVTQNVSRENLLNMVAGGFGVTLTSDSALGGMYSGVSFVPVGDPVEIVVFSMIWSKYNKNPALRKLLGLCIDLAGKHHSSREIAVVRHLHGDASENGV